MDQKYVSRINIYKVTITKTVLQSAVLVNLEKSRTRLQATLSGKIILEACMKQQQKEICIFFCKIKEEH